MAWVVRCGGAAAAADPGGCAEDAAGGASAGAQRPAEGAKLHPAGACERIRLAGDGVLSRGML